MSIMALPADMALVTALACATPAPIPGEDALTPRGSFGRCVRHRLAAIETCNWTSGTWRSVQIYIGVIWQAPARTRNRLFILAVVYIGLVLLPSLIHVANPVGGLAFSLAWSLAVWTALMLYLTTFTSELLAYYRQR